MKLMLPYFDRNPLVEKPPSDIDFQYLADTTYAFCSSEATIDYIAASKMPHSVVGNMLTILKTLYLPMEGPARQLPSTLPDLLEAVHTAKIVGFSGTRLGLNGLRTSFNILALACNSPLKA